MFKAKQTNKSTIWVKPWNGTFMYALYCKNKVVHVGQCPELHHRIDQHLYDKDVVFDRFTSTFIEGVQPFSGEANLMEAVAIARLKPETTAMPAAPAATPKPGRLLRQLHAENTLAVA